MSEAPPSPPVCVVAGAGRLPDAAIRALLEAGESVVGIGFEGLAEAELESTLDAFRWLRLGQLEALGQALDDLGATRVLLVGKVPKTLLFSRESQPLEAPSEVASKTTARGALPQSDLVEPDHEAVRLLAGLRDRRDDALLEALAGWLVERGHGLCDQGKALAGLRAPVGSLTRIRPDADALRDLELGLPILRQIGGSGVGQCIALKAGAVLAVEAIEGTDETIRRAGRLGGPGATVLKAARPDQDRRFDLPVVGPGTVEALVEAGASALAIESDSVLILDREEVVAQAERAGVAIWAFGVEGVHS